MDIHVFFYENSFRHQFDCHYEYWIKKLRFRVSISILAGHYAFKIDYV